MMRWIAFLLLPAVLLLAVACEDEGNGGAPVPTDTLRPSATDTPVPPAPQEDAGASSLAEQVAAKCVESAVEVQRMAERAVEFIEQDFGRRVSTDTVLQELDQSTSGMTNVQCSEHLAALIVLIGQG